MATKRRRADNPVLRGVTLGAAAKLRLHLQENPEEMECSQKLSALKWQESRKHQELSREMQVRLVDLKCPDGGIVKWGVPNMAAVMKWHIQHNPLFLHALQRAVRAHNMPMKIMVYSDEMVPGNVLHPEQRRKMCNWFITILQFQRELSSEHLWLPIASLLSAKMKKLEGTCSQAHRKLMELAIQDVSGLTNAGLVLDGQLVMFKLEDPLADELGLKSINDIKGASGIKPCIKCSNVFMKGHRYATMPGNVDICCAVFSKFEQMTNEDLWDAHDALEQQKPLLRKTPFEALETALGVNYSPEGVLASRVLRETMHPVESRYDRMHCFESKGNSETEIGLLLESLSSSKKFSNYQVQSYCNASWENMWGPVSFAFRDDKLKGMASDVLNAVPILFHFAKSHLQNWDKAKVDSFEALFLVTKQLEHVKHASDCSREATSKLSDLLQRHLGFFQAAYSADEVKPKHHYSAHLPEQYEKDGFYADCFAPERHQKLIKAIADSFSNTSAELYEFYILSRVHRAMQKEVEDALNMSAKGKAVEFQGEPFMRW